MIAYINSKKNWALKKIVQVVSDDTSLESVYVERSVFVIKDGAGISEDDIFCFTEKKYTGLIVEVEPNEKSGTVTIRTEPIWQLFSRDLVVPEQSLIDFINTPGFGIESFIYFQLISEFMINFDPQYQMPYLDIVAETHTTSSMGIDQEKGLYSILSFMSKARRLHNIKFSYTPTKEKLHIRIYKDVNEAKVIDLTKPGFTTSEEKYSVDTVAKVKVYCEEDSSTTEYYLLEDGTITITPGSAVRASGKFKTISVDKIEKIEDSARDTFAKNIYSHLITFSKVGGVSGLGLYDSVLVKTKSNRILKSYISSIRMISNSNSVIYKTGELRTSLESKVATKYK